MIYLTWIALFAPLIGFIKLMAFSQILKRRVAHVIGCSTILFSFISFATVLFIYQNNFSSPINTTLFNWIPAKGFYVDFMLHIDPLSLVMALVITGIGFLIHVYSIGYTEHEEDFIRYFACMNFFVFSMLLLVLAGHLFVLFIGWEGVGLASYLLIGYWYTRPAAAAAATKAFVMNRIADFGLIIALLLTFYTFGTGVYTEIFSKIDSGFIISASLLTAITLLYFVGAIGKSAQLPLYTWLPDAMEGPTPVSALIHAATMVTAGVYLLVRMHPLLTIAPYTLETIGIIGVSTALFAAFCALAQTDLKRVLAFSTISQLGFMFVACGIGSFFAAMFHLVAHAFMKSLLFLTAGNVVHGMSTTDMGKMGGLKKEFPATHVLFLIGTLAMSGIPPLVAFFSKDLILEQARLGGYTTLYASALFAAFLTGIYLTRAYCLTFTGSHRTTTDKLKAVKEAPRMMLIPCVLLCIFTIFGGILKIFFKKIGVVPMENFLDTHFFSLDTFISTLVAFFSVAATALVYTKYSESVGKNWTFLKNAFYIDTIYNKFFITPLKITSSIIIYIIEPRVFIGSLQKIGSGTLACAKVLQRLQSGLIRSYIVWIFIGSMLLFGFLLLL